MDSKQLDMLLKEGEGQYVEFKENISDIARDFCAFANANGGKILVGISDNGTLKGIEATNRMKAQIQDMARHCDPKIEISIKSLNKIMVITVLEGENKPYQCREGFFLRNGASSEKLKRDEIINFVVKEGRVRFDEIANKEFRISADLDQEKLERYKDYLGVSTVKMPYKNLLLGFDAAENRKSKCYLKNGAILFFANDPQKYFKDTYTTCVRYQGKEKEKIIDRRDIYGDLISQVEEILKFISKNTMLEYIITGNPKRIEKSEYPAEALREAVLNALMHRDYFIEGANVFVEIFDDRIEVANPGGLVKGLRMEDLGKRSVRRNRLIADLFHRAGMVEKVGSGIRRMKNICRQYGAKTPKITVENHWFEIVFFSRMFSENVPINVPINVPVNVPVNERQKKILFYISKHGKASFKAIKLLFKNISEKTLKRDISYLKKAKIIGYKGSHKKGYYVLLNR